MPRLGPRRAALLAGLVALVIYAAAFRNGWALDDNPIVAENPAAHSIGAAADAAFEPYWPESAGVNAGMYRPFVMLTYGIDWTLSGGSPGWFHVSNAIMHAVATILVVLVVLRWFPPVGALAAGVAFAVHPVHVEAVANVVGRAEVLVTVWILAAVLSARRYRRHEHNRSGVWLVLTIAFTLLAMLSKEHGVMTVFVLALDHFLDIGKTKTRRAGLYIYATALTLGWFYVWGAIAGGFVESTIAANVRGLDAAERLATALPVIWDVTRLLVWPFELAADYNPMVIPRRTELGIAAGAAVVFGVAVVVLAVIVAKKAPAITFGVLVAVASYAPTSNLFFSSGVALAERTLYLAALAPALALGWVITRAHSPRIVRATAVAVAVLCTAYGVRTFTRTPFWKDNRTVIVEDLVEHPENFRAHIRVGRVLEQLGDSTAALGHYVTAASIFPYEPLIAPMLVPLASSLGRHQLALREAERSLGLEPGNPRLALQLAGVHLSNGDSASALAVARSVLSLVPDEPGALLLYADMLAITGAPDWKQQLSRARAEWLLGRPVSATQRWGFLLNAVAGTGTDPAFCDVWGQNLGLVRTLRPDLYESVMEEERQAGASCGW